MLFAGVETDPEPPITAVVLPGDAIVDVVFVWRSIREVSCGGWDVDDNKARYRKNCLLNE